MQLICEQAKQAGAFDAVQCTHWADGGAGAVELGRAVQKAAEAPSNFSFLYDTEVISAALLACTSSIHLLSDIYILLYVCIYVKKNLLYCDSLVACG